MCLIWFYFLSLNFMFITISFLGVLRVNQCTFLHGCIMVAPFSMIPTLKTILFHYLANIYGRKLFSFKFLTQKGGRTNLGFASLLVSPLPGWGKCILLYDYIELLLLIPDTHNEIATSSWILTDHPDIGSPLHGHPNQWCAPFPIYAP